MRTSRRISLVTALIAAVWLMMPPAGVAQIDIPILDEPTTSPSPTPKPSSTSSPKPKASSSPKQSTSGSGSGSGSGSSGSTSKPRQGSGSAPAPTRAVSPVVQKGLGLWRERAKSPARTTTRLLELLDQAHDGPGEPTPTEMRRGFGRFPVVGYVWYQDDYGAPRFKPYYSAHEGNDLFAERGTPVMAVADGYVWRMGSFSKGGNAVWLMGDDGLRYYYGHLHRIAKGLKTGMRLKLGDLVGTVGNTGNAVGTYPHVHFEINPGGLGTVNPKPILDRWLFDAERAVMSELGLQVRQGRLTSFGAAHWNRLIDLFAEPAMSPPALWTAGLGGSGGLLAYADVALAELLAMQNWDALVGSSGPPGAGGEDARPLDPLAGLYADAAAASHADGDGH